MGFFKRTPPPAPKHKYWRKWRDTKSWYVMYGRTPPYFDVIGTAFSEKEESEIIEKHKNFKSEIGL